MTEPKLPPMIELRVPVGEGPGEVWRSQIPLYFEGRPPLELLEEAVRAVAEQTIQRLRSEQWLWDTPADRMKEGT